MGEHAQDHSIVFEEVDVQPIVEVVDEQEAQIEGLNQGEEPIAARVEVGSEQRRRTVQCQKIDSPRDGLFAVAQSGERQMGNVSSLVARDAIAAHLGDTLDKEVRNIERSGRTTEERTALIDAHIRQKMKEMYQQIADQLALQTKLIDGLDRLSVKPTVAKIVDLPSGDKRMYIGHVGDNRVYLERDGKLYLLTQDQTSLRQQADSGIITEEQYQRIDQSSDPSKLSREDGQMFGMRDQTVMISSKGIPQPSIMAFDVAPGDRIVIGNEGLQKNALTSEIGDVIRGSKDDRIAEKSLQLFADRQVGAVRPRERSAAREIAAIVHTIPEGKRDTWRDEQAAEREAMTKQLEAQVTHHDQEAKNVRLQRIQLEQAISEGRITGGAQTISEARRRLHDLKLREANHEFQSDRARLGIVDQMVPPRLAVGETVQLQRDGEQVQVVEYDEKAHKYVLRSANGEEVRKTRWQIEPIQPGFMPAVGDIVPIFHKAEARFEPGYRVVGFGQGGVVELRKGDEPPVFRRIEEIRGNLVRELRNKDTLAKEAGKKGRHLRELREFLTEQVRQKAIQRASS